jgi:hypothetical protein
MYVDPPANLVTLTRESEPVSRVSRHAPYLSQCVTTECDISVVSVALKDINLFSYPLSSFSLCLLLVIITHYTLKSADDGSNLTSGMSKRYFLFSFFFVRKSSQYSLAGSVLSCRGKLNEAGWVDETHHKSKGLSLGKVLLQKNVPV